MSYITASRLAAVSVSAFAALMAVSGMDLAIPSEVKLPGSPGADSSVAAAINRAAKSDRGILLPVAPQTTTVSFRLIGQTDASIVMRLPSAEVPRLKTERDGASASRPNNPIGHKMMVACEPAVSPLSAAARTLGPGRCVT